MIYPIISPESAIPGDFLPEFMHSRYIDLSIATSDYCQARCNNCIWPYMSKQNHVLSVDDFQRILAKFSEFTIGELTLNIINEPFTDKSIIKKLNVVSAINQKLEVLFFSSNWLIPDDAMLDEFASSIQNCAGNPNIEKIHLNATISGIDRHTYDIQQAGVELVDAVAPYRELDFDKAILNIKGIIERLANISGFEKVRFRIKAYGDAFTEDQMNGFWARELNSCKASDKFIRNHVKIMLNQGFTTFARSFNAINYPHSGKCTRDWLSKRLVIGPQGEVGLCCEDGLNRVTIGNILDQELSDLIRSQEFQYHLSIVSGRRPANIDHPCHRCSFFRVAE